jgi:CBS domain-containing protein
VDIMQARDIMTRPVITFRAGTPVREAAAVLTERGITAAPVVDEAEELIGMVSEADLIVGRFPHDPRSHLRRDEGIGDELAGAPRTVGEVMTRTVIAMSASADAADLAQAMVDGDVRSIPIVTGSAVIGIVSRRDLRGRWSVTTTSSGPTWRTGWRPTPAGGLAGMSGFTRGGWTSLATSMTRRRPGW